MGLRKKAVGGAVPCEDDFGGNSTEFVLSESVSTEILDYTRKNSRDSISFSRSRILEKLSWNDLTP